MRRMILWQITCYHTALDLGGPTPPCTPPTDHPIWPPVETHGPAEVVWMLGTAPFAEEACTQVEAMIGRDKPSSPSAAMPEAEQQDHTDDTGKNTDQPEDQLEHAMRINKQHWASRSRPVSADTLREQLHIGAEFRTRAPRPQHGPQRSREPQAERTPLRALQRSSGHLRRIQSSYLAPALTTTPAYLTPDQVRIAFTVSSPLPGRPVKPLGGPYLEDRRRSSWCTQQPGWHRSATRAAGVSEW
jgi:hypothetical protein